METIENTFLDTVLNSPDKIKKFLIDQGNDGKSTCPIYFFSEEEKDKFVRQNKE